MKTLILLVLSLQVSAFDGKVTKITDGDTINVTSEGTTIKVRFYGVDAPESNQPGGKESTEFVEEFIDGKEVTVIIHSTDFYGRKVGEIFVDGKSLNRESVRSGHSWYYERYARRDKDLARLMESAKSSQRGLWKADSPIAPWDWRRGQR